MLNLFKFEADIYEPNENAILNSIKLVFAKANLHFAGETI
jgi:hypothetical protein